MEFLNIKIFAALKAKMSYLSERQTVITSNIANANTPGYRAKDLKPADFNKMVEVAYRKLPMSATSESHIAGNNMSGNHYELSEVGHTFETTPNGNNVVLEEETMKMAELAHNYQLTTRLYKKMSDMLKAATGNSGQA